MIDIEYDPKEAIKQLKQLEEGLQGKAIRAGLTGAIRPILKAMKANVPVDEGALKKSLGRSTLSKRAKSRIGIPVDEVAVLIGPNRKVNTDINGVTKKRHQGYKAIWLEYGTMPGNRPNQAFVPARPFMAPAFENNISEVESRFYDGLQNFIDRV